MTPVLNPSLTWPDERHRRGCFRGWLAARVSGVRREDVSVTYDRGQVLVSSNAIRRSVVDDGRPQVAVGDMADRSAQRD